jgi:metacaspase-1
LPLGTFAVIHFRENFVEDAKSVYGEAKQIFTSTSLATKSIAMSFDDAVKLAIPSVVNLVASASDNQQSEESYNVRKFGLPNPAGKSGGACTCAFLSQQYAAANIGGVSWLEMLKNMHDQLKELKFTQTPTLSSSREIKANSKMEIVPPGSAKRRALLIGINYVGQEGELQSCHNDCLNVRECLKTVHNFRDDEMMVLMDDGVHSAPTKENIENGFILLTKYSQPGDVVFVSFSGHGGRTKDHDGDEADGWDST